MWEEAIFFSSQNSTFFVKNKIFIKRVNELQQRTGQQE